MTTRVMLNPRNRINRVPPPPNESLRSRVIQKSLRSRVTHAAPSTPPHYSKKGRCRKLPTLSELFVFRLKSHRIVIKLNSTELTTISYDYGAVGDDSGCQKLPAHHPSITHQLRSTTSPPITFSRDQASGTDGGR